MVAVPHDQHRAGLTEVIDVGGVKASWRAACSRQDSARQLQCSTYRFSHRSSAKLLPSWPVIREVVGVADVEELEGGE